MYLFFNNSIYFSRCLISQLNSLNLNEIKNDLQSTYSKFNKEFESIKNRLISCFNFSDSLNKLELYLTSRFM